MTSYTDEVRKKFEANLKFANVKSSEIENYIILLKIFLNQKSKRNK